MENNAMVSVDSKNELVQQHDGNNDAVRALEALGEQTIISTRPGDMTSVAIGAVNAVVVVRRTDFPMPATSEVAVPRAATVPADVATAAKEANEAPRYGFKKNGQPKKAPGRKPLAPEQRKAAPAKIKTERAKAEPLNKDRVAIREALRASIAGSTALFVSMTDGVRGYAQVVGKEQKVGLHGFTSVKVKFLTGGHKGEERTFTWRDPNVVEAKLAEMEEMFAAIAGENRATMVPKSTSASMAPPATKTGKSVSPPATK